MSDRPRLLDLFCCAGGASMGYHRAGFDVVGVDIAPQPNYPFDFIHADALEFIRAHGHEFDAIHLSPPCQRNSTMTRRWGADVVNSHPELIAPSREIVKDLGIPYIIENVAGAPLLDPIVLCGGMFDLGTDYDGEHFTLRRHRLFESNLNLVAPPHPVHEGRAVGVYGHPGGSSKRDGIKFPQAAGWREAMGIDWMRISELAEALPPAYTQHLGRQLMEAISG
jgi:DNA (cytosine-5)-methyltransferase 1